jgi:hypothetical protein
LFRLQRCAAARTGGRRAEVGLFAAQALPRIGQSRSDRRWFTQACRAHQRLSSSPAMGEEPTIFFGGQDSLALPQLVAPDSEVKSAQKIEPRGRSAAFRTIAKTRLENSDTDRAEPCHRSRSHEVALTEALCPRVGSRGTLVFPGIMSFRSFRTPAGLTQREKFKFRRQSLQQPTTGFDFARSSRRSDLIRGTDSTDQS